jgi:hypothetical protein
VSDASCLVPRTPYIQSELRRKVRTMARGIRTLFYHRALMNPFRYGAFALMLISHKLIRWLPYLLAPVSIGALAYLATQSVIARAALALAGVITIVGTLGMRYKPLSRSRPVAASAFLVAALAAGFLAWCDVLRGVRMSTWEPTQRPDTAAPSVMSAN